MPRKKTQEEYIKEFNKQSKGDYILLSEYKGATKNIVVKHLKCGTVYNVTPTRFREGTRCPNCAIKNRTKTEETFKKELLDLGKGEYELLSNYINSYTSVRLKHKNCGTIYEVRPNDFISGRRCPYCGGGRLRKDWLKRKLSSVNSNVKILGEYKDNKAPLKVKCNVCGNIWLATTSNLLQGYGCPICSESHGERFIRNYLDNNNIKYESQKKFNNLKDKQLLSYDFYLPEYNILIEYQGKQHYENNGFFGGEEQFKKQQYHDRLKKEYAKKNHYKLLELHYSLDTQDKVDTYLNRRIKG